jgi:eukaryotic-like serine/threonine-protein kinase
MALATGTKLGAYELGGALGAGGMGEVYRARDPRLKREVAIKVLPAVFSADPHRLRRFEQEAHAAAALNDPNILSVYDIGTENGIPYIVSELLQGETLRERLRSGSLTVRKAVDYALQIARGLATAHDKGIVHRDLKPENIFITDDGRVKILDFGLAKLTRPETDGEAQTLTRTADTEAGTVLGTVGYMSPEQVRGKPADARSDLFSLGAIFYEMLSGKRAFCADSAAETMSAVIKEEPADLLATNRSVPPALERLIRHCLEKNPAERFQSARDIAFDLETISAISVTTLPPAKAPESRRWRTAAISLIVLLLVAINTFLVFRHSQTAAGPSVATITRITHDPALSESPTWSPNGSLLAFASNRDGKFEIYVRRVEGGQEVNITRDDSQNYQPAFSPDGNSVAFISTRASRSGMIKIGGFGFDFRTYGGDLWLAPALGGGARRLAEDANYPAWSPDGQKIAYVSGVEAHRSIMELLIAGGTPRPLLSGAASQWEIRRVQYSPTGHWLSFETFQDEIMLMPIAGGQPHLFVDAMSHAWAPSGNRLYCLQRDRSGGTRLMSLDVDENAGTPVGEARTVSVTTGFLRDIAIAPDGKSIAVSELEGSLNMTRLPLNADGSTPAGPEEVLTPGHVMDRFPRASRDGQRIAFGSDRMGSEQIWIMDVKSQHTERLDLPGSDISESKPEWTADGRQIILTRAYKDDKQALWSVALDGSRAEELIATTGVQDVMGGGISPDGRTVLYVAPANGVQQLFSFNFVSRRAQQLTSSPGDKVDGIWSPDGKSIAFFSNLGGTLQLWKMAADGTHQQQLTTGYERIRHAFFAPDGKWLYYQPSHRNIFRMAVKGGATQQVTHFPDASLFIEEPSIWPDGKYLLYTRSNGGASLWLLKLR